MSSVPNIEQFLAAVVLCGVGDALGYKNGEWEFSGVDSILRELKDLGGLEKLEVRLPHFMVSDDTVLNIASGEGLLKPAKNQNKMLQNLYNAYCDGMRDMSGRAPGATCGRSLRSSMSWDHVPFGPRDGGCGAAMRGMAIGVRFWKPEMLSNLIIVSLEGSRMSHHHPTGYLGGVVAALFTSYALQGVSPYSWGAKFRDEVLPLCKEHVKKTVNRNPKENLESFNYFENHWNAYLVKREIALKDNKKPPVFPARYGVHERDAFYKSVSFGGWGGASGHDSVIIAYDALLGAIQTYTEARQKSLSSTTASASGAAAAASASGACTNDVSTSSSDVPPSSDVSTSSSDVSTSSSDVPPQSASDSASSSSASASSSASTSSASAIGATSSTSDPSPSTTAAASASPPTAAAAAADVASPAPAPARSKTSPSSSSSSLSSSSSSSSSSSPSSSSFSFDSPAALRWRETLRRGALHSGDSDSTGAIVCAWYGALYGFEGVYPNHLRGVEYLKRMKELGEKLKAAADNKDDPFNYPWTIGEIH